MSEKEKIVEDSEKQVELAIANEMDEIGPGDMPKDVKEEEKKEKK